jgi:hypothetical protein
LVIAVTFFGTTIAATILPWKQKEIYDGSPIAKYKVPNWLGWVGLTAFTVASIYLIITSFRYAGTILGGLSAVGASGLTWIIVILLAVLTLINAGLLIWILYYVAKNVTKEAAMPLITFAGLIFLAFLDWLLVVWFWDPTTADGVAMYAIGWSNVSSMLFMIFNYVLAAAIYYGFSAYRRNQGIDVDKVYKEIPVE